MGWEEWLIVCLVGTEAEDGEEEYDQLPHHEAVSEDEGADEAGEMKRGRVE